MSLDNKIQRENEAKKRKKNTKEPKGEIHPGGQAKEPTEHKKLFGNFLGLQDGNLLCHKTPRRFNRSVVNTENEDENPRITDRSKKERNS